MHIARACGGAPQCDRIGPDRVPFAGPALAADPSLSQTISSLLDFNRQEVAVLTTALALLGFSVVASILLMHNRVRAARTETKLRADIGDLQAQADSLPDAAVRGTADRDLVAGRRQPAAHLRRHLAGAAAGLAAAHPRLWNLAAAGTGAADGSRGRRAARDRRKLPAQPHHIERPCHRGDGPRHRRPGHRPDSRRSRA